MSLTKNKTDLKRNKEYTYLCRVYFIKSIGLGFKSYWLAWKFIVKHKIYWYVLIPASLMIFIFQLGHKLQLHTPEIDAQNMNQLIWFFIQLSAEILSARLLMSFSKYLVVILLSPLISHISQKTEFILTKNTYSFDFQQLLKDIKRGLRIAFRNITWEIFLFSLIFLISLIGWGTIAGSPLHFLIYLVSFYYYGFSFLDYISERLQLSFEESVQLTRRNRGLALVLGGIYSLMLWSFIDLSFMYSWQGKEFGLFMNVYHIVKTLLLWFIASIAPILTIVAATLAMHELYDLKSAKKSIHEKHKFST